MKNSEKVIYARGQSVPDIRRFLSVEQDDTPEILGRHRNIVIDITAHFLKKKKKKNEKKKFGKCMNLSKFGFKRSTILTQN